MLAEMVRLSYQHRAFYCYVILSVWIFLLVAGKKKNAILHGRHGFCALRLSRNVAIKILIAETRGDRYYFLNE